MNGAERAEYRKLANTLKPIFQIGKEDIGENLIKSVDEALNKRELIKLAVLDTPPAITMAIQSVISVAELIVVPTRPSPHDLRAVGATVDLCERAGKPLVFVVNAATPKAKITSEAADVC